MRLSKLCFVGAILGFIFQLTNNSVSAAPEQLVIDSFDTYNTTADMYVEAGTKPWDQASYVTMALKSGAGSFTTSPHSADITLTGTSNLAFAERWSGASGLLPVNLQDYQSLVFDAKVIRGSGAYRQPPSPIGFSVNVIGGANSNTNHRFYPSAYDTWQTFRVNIAGNGVNQLQYLGFYVNRCSINDTGQIFRIDNIRASKDPADPVPATNPIIDNFESGDITWWYYDSYHTAGSNTYSGVTHALATGAPGGLRALKITNSVQLPAFSGNSYAYCRKTIHQNWNGYTTIWFDAKMANSNTDQGFQMAIRCGTTYSYYSFQPTTSWKTYMFDISGLSDQSEVNAILFYVNKTSQNRNQELYVDNIRLLDDPGVTYTNVATAKAEHIASNGTVTINDAVVTGVLQGALRDKTNPATTHKVFFIEDTNRASAIPVIMDSANVAEGDKVNVTGDIQLDRGNRVIYATAAIPAGTGTPAKPIVVTNKNCAGLPNGTLDTGGLLVTITGKATAYKTDVVGRHWLYIDDGSNVIADMLMGSTQMYGVKVLDGTGMLENLVGSYVNATGFAMNEPEIDPTSTASPLVFTSRYCRALWPKAENANAVQVVLSGSSLDWQYKVITLLHTNDMHGRMMPTDSTGGLVRAASLVRQIRTEMPNVLLFDAGDSFKDSAEDYFFNGLATTACMNTIGYQAATAGNHEFDFGLSTFNSVMANAQYPFLAANIRMAVGGGQWDRLGQYTILNVDGIKIAVLGVTTYESLSLQWPPGVSSLTCLDATSTVRSLVPLLRAQADVVVVLSHLGNSSGSPNDENLAASVPGIDFIIGGHTHTVINPWRWIGNTLVAQAGSYGNYLGRIDFMIKTNGTHTEITSVNGKTENWGQMANPPLGYSYPNAPILAVNATVPEDPTTKAAYMPYHTSTDTIMATVLGQAAQNIPGGIDSADETLIRDFVADAVKSYAGSDCSIVDSNSVSDAGLYAGPVTKGMCFNLIGGFTRQQIIVGRMTGANLSTALQARTSGTGALGYAFGGMTFDYAHPGATNIKINGVALDPARNYTIAAQAYVMQYMMNNAPVTIISEMNGTTREALFYYVQTQGTVYPPTFGRIRRL